MIQHLHLGGGGSPHGITNSANRGKWVINVVTSDTTTHYTRLYIKKNCVSQQEPQRFVVTEVLMALLAGMGRTGDRRDAKGQRIEALSTGLINVDLKQQ